MANYTPSTPNNFLAVRAELDKIAEAIEWQVDREGSSPNFMEADLDMNGYALLNYDVENASVVSSVFGRTGAITAEAGDYSGFYLTDIANQSIGELADINLTGLQVGYVLSWNGIEFIPSAGSGGVSSLTGLTDTPNTYTGNQGKVLIVDPTGSEMIFTNNVDNLIDTIDGGAF
ncbi:hypothetical protein NVP1208B_23 [Vibrio phage 1.208.B._10N.222.52.A7]|nr:hypothetical protein NVP1208B_23 [Vibrio phage 1.208.B._10N.222.52.A7]